MHQTETIPDNSKTWKRKEQKQEGDQKIQLVRFNQESQSCNKLLMDQVNSEFEEWLNRSFVCTLKEPRDLATLASVIINGFGQCKKIYALSSHEFILTFAIEIKKW